MDELIEALQIFRKYANHDYPTHCEHDVLIVYGIHPDIVSEEDKARLEEIGFMPGDPFGNEDAFYSYKYGSC